jgi:hypothetical protein
MWKEGNAVSIVRNSSICAASAGGFANASFTASNIINNGATRVSIKENIKMEMVQVLEMLHVTPETLN